MRRYAMVSAILLLVAAFVAAWVNAQEVKRPRTRVSFSDIDAPAPFDSDASASPIDGGTDYRAASDSVLQAGGAGEPEEAEPRLAMRPLRSGSRLGPTVMPAAPVAEPANLDGEMVVEGEIAPIASPNMPSVLKKRAGSPPSAGGGRGDSRISPAVIGSDASEAVGTSRRPITTPKSISIRSTDEAAPTPKTQVSASASAANPKLLQIAAASPQIVVEAVGPAAVTIGKPAAYKVRLANESNTPADDVAVRIGLPQWVKVGGGEGSHGDARQEKDAAGRQWLVWSIPQVAAGGKEHLDLELVAHQNQPFELAMHWSARPTSVAAEVAVREPQVEVRLEGPSDMLFGEQKQFTLHISNPGTGDAENVVVQVASGGGQPNRLEVGTLPAGQQKQVPFTVSATAPGEMEIRAVASGSGGLATEAASRVLVHKPELQVAIDVPPMKFAGAESSYQVAVANVGDALAEQVTLNIALPAGAKYLGGIDGAAKAGDGLTLKIGSLAPNSEKVFEVRCMLTQAGENHFQISARGKGDLAASQTAVTQVEALADLKLAIVEPSGPVAVGGEAIYEIKITNRGTRAAEKVKVVVQFGQGIEPVDAVGGTAAISNGQALFEPLAEVPAGKEVTLKVKAKGEAAGSHAFRVEVKGDPETRLVAEGTTRCFVDSAAGKATARKSPLQPVPATKMR